MRQLGHYQVIGELGRGGMGVVFKAWDPLTQAHVAIKLLLASHNPKRLSRFKREVQVLQRLQHPNVIPIRAFGEENGRPYLVMSLIDGKSLESLIDERGPLPPSMVAEIGQKLASALSAAHELGILHRDVKPDNVLLRADGEVVLGDFGLAKDLALEQSQLTVEGGFMGTPGFVAPEQAMGEAKLLGPATDVYGLGATLYYALTGLPPVEGDTVFQIVSNLHKPPKRIRSLRPDVPKELANLVQRCLKAELRERYRSCVVVERDLDDFLRGISRYATPGAVSGGRKPWALALGMVVLAGLAVTFALLIRDPGPTVDVDPAGGGSPVVEPLGLELRAALDEARVAVERGDWDAARAGFEQVLLIDADNPDGLHGLWDALRELEDPRQLEVLRRAVAVEPRGEANHRLALVLHMRGQPEESMDVLREGLAVAPKHPDLLESYGRALANAEQFDKALPYLEQAWAIEPDTNCAVAYAKCLDSAGQGAEALEVLEQAVDSEPTSVEAQYLLGFYRFSAKLYAKSIGPLQRAWRSTKGGHLPSAHPLASALREVGRPEDALGVINGALDSQPQSVAYLFTRSSILDDLGRGEEELNDLNAVLALDPEHVAGLNNRSLVLFETERYEAALADATKLVQLEADSISGWTQIGACFMKLKRHKEARDAYTKVASLDAQNLGARVGRGQAYHHLDEYEAAIADYTWILARVPDEHSIRLNLGYAYKGSGQLKLARETIQEVVRRTDSGSRLHTKASDWLEKNAPTQPE